MQKGEIERMPTKEFVVRTKVLSVVNEPQNISAIKVQDHKWYDIADLDRYDEILREDNRKMLDVLYEDNRKLWERVIRRLRNDPVEIFTPKQRKYESEPEMIKVATMPIEDAKRKFG
jgi:hypothetical protein